MDKKNIEEKNIVEGVKDRTCVTVYPLKGIIVHTNIEDKEFKLGEDIDKYKSLKYNYQPKLLSSSGEALDFDSYALDDYPITLWVDDESGKEIVYMIDCNKTCSWQGKELIGMPYEDFLTNFHIIPDSIDKQWTSGPFKNDRNYDIYRFYCLGIELWVWRKRIRSVLINTPIDEG